MAKIPYQNLTKHAVEDSRVINSVLRPYLGYSSFGEPCANLLWLTFRWTYTKSITPRLERLFNRGHHEEPIIVADLERAGMKCSNVVRDGMTDKEADAAQVEVVGGLGHIKGHPDGDVIGVLEAPEEEHNLEMKTANDKNFKAFQKAGIQATSPKYYAQANAYMHHKKQQRTLFVITNKNTDERLYERVHYDKDNFQFHEDRATDIISSSVPMPKISQRPEWFECKWCDAKDVCHSGQPYEKSCRTCVKARVMPDGQWWCNAYQANIPIANQRTGCERMYVSIL